MNEGTDTIPRKPSVADYCLEQCMADLLTAEERIASIEEDNAILRTGWKVAIGQIAELTNERNRLRATNRRLLEENRELRFKPALDSANNTSGESGIRGRAA
jgi:hypothetical protein